MSDGESRPEGGGPTDGRLVGGRYLLGAHLGSGGMGTVWLARDELLQRDVAVKEVRVPTGMPSAELDRMRQRYLREARAAARLHHPGVVGVYDVLPEHDQVWIVMEYVSARNLAEVIKDDGVLPPARVARIGLQVLDALDTAHRAGVLHRDVKPANVLVDVGKNDRAVLTDFGVASVSGDVSLTRTGQLVGSPAYFSPERLTGGDVGPASDLWSLGCLLYAAVEGKPPFLREEQFAVITAITLDPVPAAPRAGLLAPVLTGLLDKDTETRWDAARARAALARVAEGLPAETGDETESSWGGAPAPTSSGATGRAPVSGPPVEYLIAPSPWPGEQSSPGYGQPTGPAGTLYGTPSGYHQQPTPGSGPPAGSSSPGWSSGPPAVSSSPGWSSGPPAVYGGAFAAPPPPPRARSGRRWWLWFVAAFVVLVLAGGAALLARAEGWLAGGGGASPTPTSTVPSAGPTGPTSPTATTGPDGLSLKVFDARDGSYQLSYPAGWNQDCVDQQSGRKFCYFDEIPQGRHQPTDSILNTSPYVLVLTGPAEGLSALEGLRQEHEAVRTAKAFPDYELVKLRERTYAGNAGAELEFTATGEETKLPRTIRVFRIVVDDTFYEVSLRSPTSKFKGYEQGYETVAGSLEVT